MSTDHSANRTGETYLYGIVEQLGETTLLFAPEAYARAHLREIAAWRAVATWGEAIRLARTDLVTPAPFAVEDAEEYEAEHDEDDPFRADDMGAAQDGDWPASIQTCMLDWVDADTPVGEQHEAFPSHPWLVVDPSEEDALVAYLTEAGHVVRRDDELVQQLAAR